MAWHLDLPLWGVARTAFAPGIGGDVRARLARQSSKDDDASDCLTVLIVWRRSAEGAVSRCRDVGRDPGKTTKKSVGETWQESDSLEARLEEGTNPCSGRFAVHWCRCGLCLSSVRLSELSCEYASLLLHQSVDVMRCWVRQPMATHHASSSRSSSG